MSSLVYVLTRTLVDWKRTFHPNWRYYRSEFDKLLKRFDLHGTLIQRLVSNHQDELSQISTQRMNDHFLRYHENWEEMQQHNRHNWEGMNEHMRHYEKNLQELIREASNQEIKRKQDQRADVIRWIDAPTHLQESHHGLLSSIREEFPGTGTWILRVESLSHWINAETPTQSMLWMNSKKGSGKAITIHHKRCRLANICGRR
jgi:hypothetical protein